MLKNFVTIKEVQTQVFAITQNQNLNSNFTQKVNKEKQMDTCTNNHAFFVWYIQIK